MRAPKQKFLQRFSRIFGDYKNQKIRLFLILISLSFSIRLLPYLAPICPADIAQNQQAIEFSDRFGRPLGTLLTRDQEHTAVVPLKQVSPHFIQAIIAAEDARFYQHGALDLRAFGRAFLEALQAKQIVSGASTITMQLARMLDPAPRTLPNKIREIWLSWRLVAGMNKHEILQAYINRLPMGGNIYGIEAASRTYFGIPATDLNLAQASLLAAIPNDPTYLNPYGNWQALKRRQSYVLNRMIKDQLITQQQANRALSEEILLLPREQGIIAAPHFLFWLASQLSEQHPTKIRTTLDLNLQQFVEAQVQQLVKGLATNNVHHAAALVIHNQTGEVLAYVGSPDYFNELERGRNDGVQSLRQPGSTLKPFLYELALANRRIRPNTILADVPTYYAIPGAKLYHPTNYNEETFLGPVRTRIALANSLNIPAVRVLEKVGVETFLTRLRELGFKHLTHSPEHYGLGLTLGSGEVSLWELANAYLTLAKQGEITPFVTHFSEQCSPEKNTKHSLETCLNPQSSTQKQLDSAATWAFITNVLNDDHARAHEFGVDSVLNLPFPAAVKTGTSSDFRDTWTVGFTTDYTVATWVGNFSGEPMKKVSGVMGAAPLWNRILLHLHEQQEPTAFPPIQELTQHPICAITGLRPTPDCPSIVQEYFYPEDLNEYETQAVSFQLSDEYNEWLAGQNQTTLLQSKLKIVFPQKDDYFLMNASDTTKLEFKVAGVSDAPVEWWLNGKKLAEHAKTSLFWQLKPGTWTLQVTAGDMTDTVNFDVQIAEPKPRPGFSIVQPPADVHRR